MASLMDRSFGADKLSYEIFSILESKFLFSNSPPKSPLPAAATTLGKVRILCIDAASDGGILAALSLSRLETLLKKQTADPAACVADYFDIAAGSGAGGILAAMLFTRGQDGRPLFTAEESLQFLGRNRRKIVSPPSSKNGIFRRIFRKALYHDRFKDDIFSDSTLRDAVKPVLVSCFDLLTRSPFMFSRSDAVESDGYDFLVRDICAAACGNGTMEVRSLDGKTSIKAVGGGAGMENPTAAAITHVLNNKREFPFADGPEDLLVVSLGSAEAVNVDTNCKTLATAARIAGEGATDMVDQSVAMAFGQLSSTNYVRIQANEPISKAKTESSALSAAETVLSQRHIESVMFRGKKISDQTNGEKIEWVSTKLIQEQDWRKKCSVPTVLIKPAVSPPRTSSATSTTTVTVASNATSASLCSDIIT